MALTAPLPAGQVSGAQLQSWLDQWFTYAGVVVGRAHARAMRQRLAFHFPGGAKNVSLMGHSLGAEFVSN
jgi:hypothetical protein